MKKTLGYILLGLGGFIGISLIIQLPEAIDDLTAKANTEATDPEGYIVGVIIGGIIFCVIIFSMLWFGLKLIKKAKSEKIEDSTQK